MRHVTRLSALPVRAQEEPEVDTFISLRQLMDMVLASMQALATFMMAKEVWDETRDY